MPSPPSPPPQTYKSISALKRSQRAACIPQEWLLPQEFLPIAEQAGEGEGEKEAINVMDVPRKCGLSSQQELSITEAFSGRELVERMGRGEVSAREVVGGFCKVWIVILFGYTSYVSIF